MFYLWRHLNDETEFWGRKKCRRWEDIFSWRRFYGAERTFYFPMAKCLTRRIRRRRVDKLRNQFAAGKLGQAAKPVVSFKHNKRSLPLPLPILNLHFTFKA